MTLTKEVQSQLFSPDTNQLICLPTRSTYPLPIAPAVGAGASGVGPMGGSPVSPPGGTFASNGVSWTDDEHARFLLGLEMFPSGPWKSIASIVGTRTARQTMSHAQKYRQKIARRQRGVQLGAGGVGGAASAIIGDSSTGTSNINYNAMAALHPEDLDALHLHSSSHRSSNSHTSSPVAALMSESLADLHLTSEQIDEVLQSLFENGTDDCDALVLTSEDVAAVMSTQ